MKPATIIRTIVLLGALAALETACRTGAIDKALIIAPSAMVMALIKELSSDEIEEAPRPRRHDSDAVREHRGFVERVGDEQDRGVCPPPEAQHLVAHQ